MFEIVCPVCRRSIEVPAQVAQIGSSYKCPKCWALLETITDRPLRAVARADDGGRVTVPARTKRRQAEITLED